MGEAVCDEREPAEHEEQAECWSSRAEQQRSEERTPHEIVFKDFWHVFCSTCECGWGREAKYLRGSHTAVTGQPNACRGRRRGTLFPG